MDRSSWTDPHGQMVMDRPSWADPHEHATKSRITQAPSIDSGCRRKSFFIIFHHLSSSFISAYNMTPTTPHQPTATMCTWAPSKGDTTRGVLEDAEKARCRLFFTDRNLPSTPQSTPPSTPTKRPTLVSTNAPARPVHEKSRDGHQTRGEAQRKLAGELKGADDEENAERSAALLGAFVVCVLVGVIVSHMRESCVVGALAIGCL